MQVGSTVTRLTVETILGSGYTIVGLVAVLLLISLLASRETIRGIGDPAANLRAVDVAVFPLLIAFAAVVGARLANML